MADLQTSLFDACGGPSQAVVSSNPRQRQIDSAFSRVDKWVLDTYEAIFNEFRGRTFGAWDVSAEYERRHGKMSLKNKKALGSLFQSKRHQGVIEIAGMGKRPNGNISCTYRFVNS